MGAQATCCTRRENDLPTPPSQRGKNGPNAVTGLKLSPRKSEDGSAGDQAGDLSWTVVNADGYVNVRKEADPKADILGSKHPGEVVQGIREGRWLRLCGEPGYMLIKHHTDRKPLLEPTSSLEGGQRPAAVSEAEDSLEASQEVGRPNPLKVPLLAAEKEAAAAGKKQPQRGAERDLEAGQAPLAHYASEEEDGDAHTRRAIRTIGCVAGGGIVLAVLSTLSS